MKWAKSAYYWFFSWVWVATEKLTGKVMNHYHFYTALSELSWWLDERRFDFE